MKHLFIKYLFLRHISFSERFEQPTSEVKSYHLHFLKKSRLLQWNHFSTHFSSTVITQPWDMVIFSPSHKKSWARKQSKAISVSETSCDLSRAVISALKTHLGCPTSAHYKTWHHPASHGLGWWWWAAGMRHCCSRWHVYLSFISEFQDQEASFGHYYSSSSDESVFWFKEKSKHLQTELYTHWKIFLHKPNQGPDRSPVGELKPRMCLQTLWRENCIPLPCCQVQYCCSQ